MAVRSSARDMSWTFITSLTKHDITLLNGYNPTGGQSHVKTYKNSNQLQQIIFLEHSIYTIIIKENNHITAGY